MRRRGEAITAKHSSMPDLPAGSMSVATARRLVAGAAPDIGYMGRN